MDSILGWIYDESRYCEVNIESDSDFIRQLSRVRPNNQEVKIFSKAYQKIQDESLRSANDYIQKVITTVLPLDPSHPPLQLIQPPKPPPLIRLTRPPESRQPVIKKSLPCPQSVQPQRCHHLPPVPPVPRIHKPLQPSASTHATQVPPPSPDLELVELSEHIHGDPEIRQFLYPTVFDLDYQKLYGACFIIATEMTEYVMASHRVWSYIDMACSGMANALSLLKANNHNISYKVHHQLDKISRMASLWLAMRPIWLAILEFEEAAIKAANGTTGSRFPNDPSPEINQNLPKLSSRVRREHAHSALCTAYQTRCIPRELFNPNVSENALDYHTHTKPARTVIHERTYPLQDLNPTYMKEHKSCAALAEYCMRILKKDSKLTDALDQLVVEVHFYMKHARKVGVSIEDLYPLWAGKRGRQVEWPEELNEIMWKFLSVILAFSDFDVLQDSSAEE